MAPQDVFQLLSVELHIKATQGAEALPFAVSGLSSSSERSPTVVQGVHYVHKKDRVYKEEIESLSTLLHNEES